MPRHVDARLSGQTARGGCRAAIPTDFDMPVLTRLQMSKMVDEFLKQREEIFARQSECPVCTERFEGPFDSVGQPNRALMCVNRHLTCFACISKLLVLCPFDDRLDAGAHYTCPICREYCVLKKVHITAMACGGMRQLQLALDKNNEFPPNFSPADWQAMAPN